MNDTSLTRTQATTPATAGAQSGSQVGPSVQRPALVPAVDIVEDEAGITVYADMPGVSRERLGVRVDGDSLVIEGAAEVQMPEKLEILHSEIRSPYFRRTFTLSRELDTTKIEATLKNGVLRLRLPKAEEARPRRIEINVT
jgi:HSP20 family molecular chaperone IbpA